MLPNRDQEVLFCCRRHTLVCWLCVFSDRRGAAFGLAGVVKGLGISALKGYGIIDALKVGQLPANHCKTRGGALTRTPAPNRTGHRAIDWLIFGLCGVHLASCQLWLMPEMSVCPALGGGCLLANACPRPGGAENTGERQIGLLF
jgi:hypothetical protein